MSVWLGDIQPGDLPIDAEHNLRFMGFVDTMKTATGRRIAEERAEWMASFRSRLLREIG